MSRQRLTIHPLFAQSLAVSLIAAGTIAGCAQPVQPTQPPAVTAATAPGLATTAPTSSAVSDFEALFPQRATLELLFDDVGFTEGPLWLADGRLIFSRMSDNIVAVVGTDGSLSDFLNPSNGANGHAFDWSGNILQAEHAGRVTRLEANGTVTVLVETFEGKRLNSPNDLVVRSDGVIFFTDPTFGLNGRESEIGFQGVYQLDPVTQSLTAIIRDLPMPNGIGLSPDESTLYVSDTTLAQVFAYALNGDGSVGERRAIGSGIDGLLVDSEGRIWSSAPDGVHVLTPDGQDLGLISLPQGATNVGLGGPDGHRLFITTSTGLYAIDTLVVEAAPGH